MPKKSPFEKRLRTEVSELAERLEISESKAFAVWYGKVALRLGEVEALEAASYDGGNDRGTDFFYVDDEWDRVIIAQWKYFASASKAPKAQDITHLFNIPSELSDPQDLRDDGRPDLAEAAEALEEARDRGYSIDLRFIYPGLRNKDRDKEPNRLVRAFNREHQGEEITAQLVRLEDLETAYDDFKGSAGRVSEGSLELSHEHFFEEEGPFGRSVVATIHGGSLASLFEEYGNKLFDQNVRLFLGNRKGSVNAGISETLNTRNERGNFWAYNNGITIVARTIHAEPDKGVVSLHDFSIVNGCQTTVSIANASDAATQDVSVLARLIAAEDPDLIEKIIRYTNSQTPINVWDISARDKLQQKLRTELGELEEPWFYALRRGELETFDKDAYGPRGARRVLAFPLSAQYLAAFRGLPVEAYKEKALLFTTHKNKVFPPDTSAQDLLWAWHLGGAAETGIAQYKAEIDLDEFAEALLRRGSRFFVTAIAAQLLRDRNGDDFAARVGLDHLSGKSMFEKLCKYTLLATVFYVSILRDLVSSADAIGALIRRPDTADAIRQRVLERLVSEKLAPQAYEEKLPTLPGITK